MVVGPTIGPSRLLLRSNPAYTDIDSPSPSQAACGEATASAATTGGTIDSTSAERDTARVAIHVAVLAWQFFS